ncbi:ATP-binding cassette domain-containing protein [Streptomyces sp. NPDC094153]|uniref:ATP-binding cassette domain-containing protein n=1 Tax=Streptomyces sp. NPDC094153 TaxID=3366058 RepID=UPI0038052E20
MTSADPSAGPAAVLRVRGVTKSFGGAAALKGVDLDLYPGEVQALMGMNGAGKSTLVQVLSGVYQPDGGTVETGGHLHPGLTVRRARRLGIASVPQRRELAMGLTVAENIMVGDLPATGGAVRWRTLRAEAREALAGLGIDIDVTRTAGSLTVAEQTMVEVAREVRRGGRVLILDEPTACLSAKDAQQIATWYVPCATTAWPWSTTTSPGPSRPSRTRTPRRNCPTSRT